MKIINITDNDVVFNLKNNQNKLLLCFIYILVFLYLTTDNLSLNDLIYSANQTDIISFYEIAKKSPEIPVQNDIVAKHDAQDSSTLLNWINILFRKF